MLEAMPEDARIKVMEFTQKLFTSRKPVNPFIPVSQEQLLSDLAESRQQISDGKGLDMEDALKRMGKQHGFICRDHLTKSAVPAERLHRLPAVTLLNDQAAYNVWQDALETRDSFQESPAT